MATDTDAAKQRAEGYVREYERQIEQRVAASRAAREAAERRARGYAEEFTRELERRIALAPTVRTATTTAVPSYQTTASRAAQIAKENPSLSNEEARAAAMAEQTYDYKVPAGGGVRSTAIAQELATLHRYEREMTPTEALTKRRKEIKEAEQKREVIEVEYKRWSRAAGIIESNSDLADKNFTIENLARFARRTPNGIQILKDYGFDDEILKLVYLYNKTTGDIVKYIDKGIIPTGTGLRSGLGLSASEQSALSRALDRLGLKPTNGSYLTTWKQLGDNEKREAAVIFSKDYTKDSPFASLAKDIERISSKHMALMLLTAPIQPITTPIGKQITLEKAREQLAKDYSKELSELKNYVKSDGSFNIDKLNKDLKANSNLKTKVLEVTGYNNVDDLQQNLEYYNYATRVTAKEWTIAGLVAALDVLLLGGGNALPAIPGAIVKQGVPTALAGVILPDVIKTVGSPKATTAEKSFAIASEVGLLTPMLLGPAVRTTQFAYLSARGDYVPLRSLSMEAATSRVPFTKAQLARMKSAGISEADIISAGTEINRQLVTGVKVAEVDLRGVKIRVRNIPYQTKVGLSLFQSTPDITLIDRGKSVPIIQDFYTAGKAAIEPLKKSYLTGQKATSPGIIEIRISDPELVALIAPQRKLIHGATVLEPEASLPSLNELKGMGYRLEPIPSGLGRGVTFDATLGKVSIRRFTLVKVVDNPTGLLQIKLGGTGDTGTVAVGDLHATTKYSNVFNDINSSFSEPVIKGEPNNPATWHWAGSKQTIIVMGDSIDRGPAYNVWRETLNRLADEAKATGGRIERLIGNHELAYLSDDAIKGIVYTDEGRVAIKQALLEDLRSGKIKAAVDANGQLFTHAGVSKGVFGEYAKKSPSYIAKDLNKKVLIAVRENNYNSKIFAKGRVERGNSLSTNERQQGGIFWLRPQEAKVSELDLGFPQVVGHNPGWDVRSIWGDNFIETDVGRRTGGVGVYRDTPYITTKPTTILVESLGGEAPKLTPKIMMSLRLNAIKDTVADVFLGWDGRVQAIEKIRASKKAMEALVKSLDEQAKERATAGDSIGVQYLMRQKRELISPTGKDYLYGGISFWRDIVMGRQNSVKVLDNMATVPKAQLTSAIATVNSVRDQITKMSDVDTKRLFGLSREEIIKRLDTSKINRRDLNYLRNDVSRIARELTYIVDEGLGRNIAPYLDRTLISRNYAKTLQSRVLAGQYSDKPYSVTPRVSVTPRTPSTIYTPESVRLPDEPTVPYTPPPYVPPPPPPPPPVPVPVPGKPPVPIKLLETTVDKIKTSEPEGQLTWKQGFGWWTVKYPYKSRADIEFSRDKPIGATEVSGVGSAYKTIQQLTGKPPTRLLLDLGIMDVEISNPTRSAGSKAIKFRRDVKRRTSGDIQLKLKSISATETRPKVKRHRIYNRQLGYDRVIL